MCALSTSVTASLPSMLPTEGVTHFSLRLKTLLDTFELVLECLQHPRITVVEELAVLALLALCIVVF